MKAAFVLFIALAATCVQARSFKDLCDTFEPLRIPRPDGMVELPFTADEKGELRIPFDDSWVASNPTIVLSDLPRKIGLVFD